MSLFAGVLSGFILMPAAQADDRRFSIEEAKWDREKSRLEVKGKGRSGRTVIVSNDGSNEFLGSTEVDDKEWRVRISNPAIVPCRVKAVQSDGRSDDQRVRNAPRDCDQGVPPPPPPANNAPVLAPIGNKTVSLGNDLSFTVSATDDGQPNGTLTVSATGLPNGANFADNGNGSGTFTWPNASPVGSTTVTFTASDGSLTDAETITVTVTQIAPPGNNAPVLAPIGNKTVAVGNNLTFTVTATDDGQPNGTLTLTATNLPNGASFINNGNGTGTFSLQNASPAGITLTTFTVTDGNLADAETITITVTAIAPPPPATSSINSTSRSAVSVAAGPVPEQPFVSNPLYQVLAINDLGMHCGDLDTRISSILPPFNVLHAQVIARGTNNTNPRILNQGEAIITYSAVSNAGDPILSIAPDLAKDGSLYKTNFWDIARQAYAPFYPSGILDAFYPAGTDIVDIGLPVPDVERLYLEDGNLHAGQQAMPGLNGPLFSNDPQVFVEHIGTLPFFTNFAFGYTSNVNWSEAAGIPISVYDDGGRQNPYPLMRVQAEVGGATVATVDTVVPISGEAECQRCHADPEDGGNGAATQTLFDNGITLALASQDPANNVTAGASIEWASDINIINLHDLKHGTTLNQGYDLTTGKANQPVVCQVCHYTPALDLAQLGPLGPENDGPLILNGVTVAASMANGRDQAKNKTMSNVMHSHHGQFTDLFPPMPPAVDAQGNKRSAAITRQILGETCYACHPGTNTECMRGAMANGGQVCQDCHGDMQQVGDDFSRDVSPTNVGAFHVAADYYTNAATPRVPWANEPGCGSCHTGDATSNLAGTANAMVNPTDISGNNDGIRLAQAFRTNDAKATPIVPTNKRFAENVVAEGTAADGNPKLYRVSIGHGGLFCESCHGATHAEWPNANPFANDNVASQQLQGHTGTITECSTCHTGNLNNLGTNGSTNSLRGPHGMHVVGETNFADGGHKDNLNRNSCRTCHGQNGQGTVLSRTAADRDFRGMDNGGLVAKGTPVTCNMCHGNEL
ncbi:MAG: cytochrome C [Gammaproteobacteria bacterium]|nr:cytochrome C [Gammaproteobacteria bacterium]